MSGAMAENRATKSGLAAETQSKVNAKYSEEDASKVLEWIGGLIGESFDFSGSMDNFQEQLKDGQKLCKLMNAVKAGQSGVGTVGTLVVAGQTIGTVHSLD